MKKLYFLALLPLLFIACDDTPVNYEVYSSMEYYVSDRRGYDVHYYDAYLDSHMVSYYDPSNSEITFSKTYSDDYRHKASLWLFVPIDSAANVTASVKINGLTKNTISGSFTKGSKVIVFMSQWE